MPPFVFKVRETNLSKNHPLVKVVLELSLLKPDRFAIESAG